MKPPLTMVMLVEDYLARRRSLGFTLQIDAGQPLGAFTIPAA